MQLSCYEGSLRPHGAVLSGWLPVNNGQNIPPVWGLSLTVAWQLLQTSTPDRGCLRLAPSLGWNFVLHLTAPMAMLGDGLDELRGHLVHPCITPNDDTFIRL